MNITKRIKKEFVSPSKGFTRKVIHNVHSFLDLFKRKKINYEKLPVLIWDIRSNPITFDFIWLIIDTFNYFKGYGFNKYDLIIYVPEGYKIKPFSWNSYDKFFTSEDLNQRIKNMIFPLAESFSCISKISFEKDKKALKNQCDTRLIYPPLYNPFSYYPDALRYARAISSISNVNQDSIPFLKKKDEILLPKYIDDNYITLTLRDHGYSPTRNSNQKDIDEFTKFAAEINSIPVIIPDDINKLSEYFFSDNVIIYREARISISHRILIYSMSNMNIFPPSGPFYVSLFLKNTKSLMYNIGVNWDDDEPLAKRRVYGYDLGDQPYLNLNGKLIWHALNPKFTSKDLMNVFNSLK